MVTTIDEEKYNEADLITITATLHIPYQSDWSHFERVNGEITIEGKVYKYIKRKIVTGQLVLVCLPDHKRMQLESARETFFKVTNSLSTTTNQSSYFQQPVVVDTGHAYPG